MEMREYLEIGSGPLAQGLAPELCSDAEASVLPTASWVVSPTTASGTSSATANRANKGVRVEQAGSRSALINCDQPLDEMVDEGDRVCGARQEEGRRHRSNSRVIFDQQDSISSSSHALDERLVVDAGTWRSIRQRLEAGNSGEIVTEQSVTVLLVMEDTTTLEPGTSKRKRMGNGKTPNPSVEHGDEERVDLLLEALEDIDVCNLDVETQNDFELLWANSSLPTRTII